MLINLNIFNIYIIATPDIIPYILFLIFVGYDKIIELNITISYTPVHSSIIFRIVLPGRYMESSTINVFMPMKFNISLDTDATLNVPITGKCLE